MTTPQSLSVSTGMRSYRVTTGDVSGAATLCTTTAQNVQDQLQTLKAYVMDLETEWLGIASQTFTALMADWDVYAHLLNQALTGIAAGLHGNWANYTSSEEQNLRNLQTVNGALPGAAGATYQG